jgi:hypothetical protein
VSDVYCRGKVFERSGMVRGWGQNRGCRRRAVRDGFCATHHPDAEKKRQADASARWEADRARERRQYEIKSAEREVVRVAVEWNEKRATTEALSAAVNALVRARGDR